MLVIFQEFSSGRKLRIGYYVDNGLFPTFSACVRAVHMAKDVFEIQGHEVIYNIISFD